MGLTTTKSEWYADGLRFGCTQCGHCCSGPSGFVWFDDEELTAMAAFVGVTRERFRADYAHRLRGHWSLNERQVGGQYDCVFLRRDDDGKAQCAIYPVRPAQCRTWPFWPDNLSSPRSWQRASRHCPGITRGIEGEGDFYPIEQIRIRREATPD